MMKPGLEPPSGGWKWLPFSEEQVSMIVIIIDSAGIRNWSVVAVGASA
jgi:hypothetical protein